MADTYTVHELLTPTCTRTSCEATALHPSEYQGSDLLCEEDGFWRQITSARGHLGDVVVDAGPITHRGWSVAWPYLARLTVVFQFLVWGIFFESHHSRDANWAY